MPGLYGNKWSNLGVILKSPSGFAGGQIPESQSFVPRPGQGIVSIAGQNHIGNKVRMPVETLLGYSILSIVPGQFPHNQGFVCKLKKKTLLHKFGNMHL